MTRAVSWRWCYWSVTLLASFLVSAVSLALIRVRPQWFHEFFHGQPDILRHFTSFLASAVAVWVLSGLFTPRRTHLKSDRHPPYWLAVWFGIAAVACWDLVWGLNAKFRVEWWHWPICGLVPFALAVALRWDWREPDLEDRAEATESTVEELLQDSQKLEAWVHEERESACDLLGTRRIARRLADRLAGNTGSVGLVGPFGSGKSTVVKWMTTDLATRHPSVLVCPVSCWGFEDAGGAVRRILSEAVKTVGRQVDCFNFRHLPEDYRQTLTAGGGWVRSVGDLVLGAPDPDEQFAALADALTAADAKLVIVVDDLDRATSGKFDPQEVLGLLSRLRKHRSRINFVLSGSRTAGFDFARLCEHIEPLPTIAIEQVASIVCAVRGQCRSAYPDDIHTEPTEDNPWAMTQYMMMGLFADYLSPPAAVAGLLQTPRALKHALRRTREAWDRLHGEVDLDHLLAVNALRFGAPQAFDFLFGQTPRFRTDPRRGGARQEEWGRHQAVVQREWERATSGVDWNVRSALELIVRLVPAAGQYLNLGPRSSSESIERRQGVAQERYWLRAVNGELDDPLDTDQRVIRAMQDWLSVPSADSDLVR